MNNKVNNKLIMLVFFSTRPKLVAWKYEYTGKPTIFRSLCA